MFRRLLRLLIIAAILVVVARVVSRFLNREEDFEDYEDTDVGLEFAETPVEIDVPYEAAPTPAATTPVATAPAETAETAAPAESSEAAAAPAKTGKQHSVIDVNGIGPTYAARLKEIGIDSLDTLASANPDDVAEKLNVIGGRNEVEDWISQAREMTSAGASTGSQSGE